MQKYADDKATNLFDPMADGESSEDEDEKQTDKWEWYISQLHKLPKLNSDFIV